MYAALRCLEDHDLKLVGWALVVCLASMVVGANAYHRATTVTGAQRWTWIVLSSVILASGVWATHFIAMLGFQPDLQLSFEGSQTALSLIVIVVGLMSGMSVSIGASSGTLRAVGGAICGVSIAAMHFVGVSAMRLPAVMIWSPHVVAMAIAFAVVLSALAFRDLTRDAGFGRRLASALILSGGVGTLHFIGMAAVTLVPADLPDVVGRFTRGELAQMVGVMVAAILLAGCGMLATFGLASRSAFGVLRSALNQAPVGLAYFDRHGLLQVWNETLNNTAGAYGLTLARGVSLAEIGEVVAPEAGSRRAAQAMLAAAGGEEWISRGALASPDGRFLSVKLSSAQDGGFLLIITDATEQVAATEREAEARRVAERASRAKSQILAEMDQEIRSPLNGILGTVQVLQGEARDAIQRERLRTIAASSVAALEILDHVLDVSKRVSGEIEAEGAGDASPMEAEPGVLVAKP